MMKVFVVCEPPCLYMVFCLVTRNCYSCTISVPPCVLSLDTRNYYFCPKWHSFVLRVSDETNFPNDNNRGDHVPVIILAVYSYVFLDFVSVWPKTENIYIYNIYIYIYIYVYCAQHGGKQYFVVDPGYDIGGLLFGIFFPVTRSHSRE